MSFSSSLACKCVFLINEPCMVRPTLINPVELNYIPLIISLEKCNAICNAVDDLSTKLCLPSKTKDVHLKVFNLITRINEAKTVI